MLGAPWPRSVVEVAGPDGKVDICMRWRGCCDSEVEMLDFGSSGTWKGQMAVYFFLPKPSVI